MKRLFLIVVVMLVIAGGGIFGLIYFEIIPNPFAESESEEAASGPQTAAPGFVPPERAPIILPLEDIIVPVILDGRVVKRVYITARVQLVPGNMALVQNGMPRFENAINQRLLPYLQDHFTRNRIIDPRGIKREMRAAAQTVYGDRVADVLLLTVFEQ